MHISSVFLAYQKAFEQELIKSLIPYQWLEIQLREPSKIIATIEADNEGDASNKISQLQGLPGVITVQMTGFFIEPEQSPNNLQKGA